jgi:hypothetical protein
LRSLSVASNGITEIGAAGLAQLLESAPAIRSLNLEDNPLNAEGLRRVAAAVAQNASLKEINVRHVTSRPHHEEVRRALAQFSLSNSTLAVLRAKEDVYQEC